MKGSECASLVDWRLRRGDVDLMKANDTELGVKLV